MRSPPGGWVVDRLPVEVEPPRLRHVRPALGDDVELIEAVVIDRKAARAIRFGDAPNDRLDGPADVPGLGEGRCDQVDRFVPAEDEPSGRVGDRRMRDTPD